MVDFNNDNTISRPPRDIVAYIVIEKLYNYIEADEDFTKKKMLGSTAPQLIAIPRARLRSLFLICHPLLQRKLSDEDYEILHRTCVQITEKITSDDLLFSFNILAKVLDDLELTKLDTKQKLNRTNIEETNIALGY